MEIESDKEAVKARTDAYLSLCDDIFFSLKDSGYLRHSGIKDLDLKLLVSNVALKTLMHTKMEDAKPANGAKWEYKPKKDM